MATVLPRGSASDKTFVAAEDLSSSQYHFGILATSTTVEVGAANEKVWGVIQNAPESGQQVVLRSGVGDESYLMVDGTTDIAVGDGLDCDASGHGVKQETDKGWIGAFALEAYTSATPGLIVVEIAHATLDV